MQSGTLGGIKVHQTLHSKSIVMPFEYKWTDCTWFEPVEYLSTGPVLIFTVSVLVCGIRNCGLNAAETGTPIRWLELHCNLWSNGPANATYYELHFLYSFQISSKYS